MHAVIELRKAKRYKLNAPAVFTWAPHAGRLQSGQGTIRDINTFGVYITASELPPVGARVQIEITLPRLLESGSGMHLHGDGVVLRCEYGDKAKNGFAASAQLYPESADSVLAQIRDRRLV